MDLYEIAWAGGFFSGEGGIWFNQVRQYRYIRASVSQSGAGFAKPSSLKRFVAAVGFGRVVRDHTEDGHKPQWYVQYGGRRAHTLVTLLWPYLSEEKQEQYLDVVKKAAA